MPRKATGTLVWHRSSWYGRYWSIVDGERKREFVSLNTQNELIARKRLDVLVAAAQGGAPLEVGTESFAAAAERVYLMRARTLAAARTEIGYLRNHVFPAIGRMAIDAISKVDVVAVLEAVRDKGHAQQTILHVRNAIGAVYRQLRREGVIEASPVPPTEDVPECLPEAIDDRPNATLEDSELYWYLAYTEPREHERFRGPVRERQLAGLLCRSVGGMRTAEALGLTWGRVGADAASFDAIEVIRYKTRRKGSRAGNKLAVRQLYTIGETVLPMFLRFWWMRTVKLTGSAPSLDAPIFPVRRPRRKQATSAGAEIDRTGERRGKTTWAAQTRRDVESAFEAALEKRATDVPAKGSRRWQELFEGTEDRRAMWFHNNRGVAADRALRNEISKAAARFTGHASGSMLQHYRERIGAVDIVPVIPQLLPAESVLRAVLMSWCEADGIDPSFVFGEPIAPRLEAICPINLPEPEALLFAESSKCSESLERANGLEPSTSSLGSF